MHFANVLLVMGVYVDAIKWHVSDLFSGVDGSWWWSEPSFPLLHQRFVDLAVVDLPVTVVGAGGL